MGAQWQLNQSGTHYSDYCGYRITVRRVSPRARQFNAKLNGDLIGLFDGLYDAIKAAEFHAETKDREI
jgi:hypothetical protein